MRKCVYRVGTRSMRRCVYRSQLPKQNVMLTGEASMWLLVLLSGALGFWLLGSTCNIQRRNKYHRRVRRSSLSELAFCRRQAFPSYSGPQ